VRSPASLPAAPLGFGEEALREPTEAIGFPRHLVCARGPTPQSWQLSEASLLFSRPS
jgi:hypothetical protein